MMFVRDDAYAEFTVILGIPNEHFISVQIFSLRLQGKYEFIIIFQLQFTFNIILYGFHVYS